MLFNLLTIGDTLSREPKGKMHRCCYLCYETLRQKDYRYYNLWRDLIKVTEGESAFNIADNLSGKRTEANLW